MDIVFNVNYLGLEGLGATLASLIKNCSNPEVLKLWFLCSEISILDKGNILELLDRQKYQGKIEFIDFNAKQVFGNLKPLHGDWTGYGRLLVKNYVPASKALYLDSDLIILGDVLSISDIHFDGTILAAVYGCPVAYALEKDFFIKKLKWASTTPYFNSGVVLFNLDEWRRQDVEQKWRNFAAKYAQDLLSIDQTILNGICEGNFAQLPAKFNKPWYPGEEKPERVEDGIIHFVGSPKPWDLLGKHVHKGFPIWNAYTPDFWKKHYSKLTKNKLIRTWKIRRSLLKKILNKIKINLFLYI